MGLTNENGIETALPQGFLEQLAPLLGDELPSFVASYAGTPCRGLRVRAGFPVPEDAAERVPWAERGYYVPLDSRDGGRVAHEAGAYYMQEPSAMAAAAALGAQPGERVLDLCAAPGGKSTQLAAKMGGRGVLVCNEPHPARAQILSRNVERLGVENAVVVSMLPERLCERWTGWFDRILVDAPCSGEGMFRRHPETRKEWNAEAPVRCADRQAGILHCAAQMLRAGGTLVYSTCTFNSLENEGVVRGFLATHPDFTLSPFGLPGVGDSGGMLRLWPHRVRGEGHFVARLVRENGPARSVCTERTALPDRAARAAAEAFCAAQGIELPRPLSAFGGQLISPPEETPPLDGVRVLRVGVHAGSLKGKTFLPDHALALACPGTRRFETDEAGALCYLRGETLPCGEEMKGFYSVCCGGMPLGWGKASDGQMKNHYPKGLRRTLQPEGEEA